MPGLGDQQYGLRQSKTTVSGHLDLHAIHRALRRIQQNYAEIIACLDAEPAELSDQILENMAKGYELVGSLVESGIDLFALGESRRILELNNVVLYGPQDSLVRQQFADQLAISDRYFYDTAEGGIGDLVEFHQRSRFRDSWHEAAAIYVRMLARPQLFIEGNHRTGALLISYILLRDGHPPFVLSPENARAFFEPSAEIGQIKRRSLAMLFKRNRLQRYFVRLLKREAKPAFLMPG